MIGAPYLWLKGLHVAAAMIFTGGVLAAATVLSARAVPVSTVCHLLRWQRRLTMPAMLLVWGLGLVLAMRGGWFAAGWLQAKLVMVIMLSGIHGIQSGRLRRLAGTADERNTDVAALPRFMALLPLGLVIGIAILAAAKP